MYIDRPGSRWSWPRVVTNQELLLPSVFQMQCECDEPSPSADAKYIRFEVAESSG
jgi:hypothetical protein